MASLFSIILSNLLIAGLLAVPAWLVGRSGRWPAVAHVLWLLVLLKLVTPPLLLLPLPWPPLSETPLSATALSTTTLSATSPPNQMAPNAEVLRNTEAKELLDFDRLVLWPDHEQTEAAPSAESPAASTAWSMLLLEGWPTLLLVGWLVGTMVYATLAGWRVWTFSHCLHQAEAPSGDLLGKVQILAEQLGVACPPVRVIHGRLSPLVWGIVRPCLVLPQGLEQVVGPAGWRTLVAHELAHLRRRDSLVRGLELLVSMLYWWCPLVWLACRELREAEEQCCDAWVVAAMPEDKKTYATALVDVLDFLCPAAVPAPLGCGLGPVANLKRRLKMILSSTCSPHLGRRAGLGLALLAFVALPLVPSFSQAQTP
ncbi:MAG: M56 family metallopeptidase, partial [Gemmataceae bacterium]